jgi:hypothetical protein
MITESQIIVNRFSQYQKMVLTKIFVAPTEKVAGEEISKGKHLVSARDHLVKQGMVTFDKENETASLTEKGNQALKDAGLVDDSDTITEEGKKFAYKKIYESFIKYFLNTDLVKDVKDLLPSQLKWLEDMEIKNWKYEEGIINVNGDVIISNKILTKIPVQFGYVSGSFYCRNNQLTSLSGAPKEVGGDFSCHNNKLTSLSGAPKEIGGNFWCDNNKLTSLSGGPKEVGEDFWCNNNQLTSLSGAPKEVGGGFYCYNNQLTSLSGGPKEVGGGFYCWNNKFESEPDHSRIKIGGEFKWK